MRNSKRYSKATLVAQIDYRHGASIDQNPYAAGTHLYRAWEREFLRLCELADQPTGEENECE